MTLHVLDPVRPDAVGLGSIVKRWENVALRLGLSEPARSLGASLLRAELDPEARNRRGGVRRGTLIATVPDAAAGTAGLTELERRGVVSARSESDWLSAKIFLDPRVRATCIVGSGLVRPGEGAVASNALPERVVAELREWHDGLERPERWFIVVRGRSGSGRDTVAALVGYLLGAPLLRCASQELRTQQDLLEPELSGAVAVWDSTALEASPEDLRRAAAWLGRSTTAAIAIVDEGQDAPDVGERSLLLIETDAKDRAERKHVWKRALEIQMSGAPELDVAAGELARRSRAGAGLAVRAARALTPAPALDLVAAAERELLKLARPSSLRGIAVEHPNVPRERLVLSTHAAGSIDRVLALAQSSTDEEQRRGVKALFSGSSGTGKSLTARIIASELRLPLFRVDLASVVSKWVGETEKNLAQALHAAESSGAVLLFDEGDALFAKRGEVQRGTDRYANMEASYLLQAFEAFDGVAIVTTNLLGNIDSAFVRRFDVCVHFQPPEPAERATLWRRELGAPGETLTPAFVDRTLAAATLTGGNIASASRLARALAAQRSDALVSEGDVCTAVGSELDKMGASVEAQKWFAKGGEAPGGGGVPIR